MGDLKGHEFHGNQYTAAELSSAQRLTRDDPERGFKSNRELNVMAVMYQTPARELAEIGIRGRVSESEVEQDHGMKPRVPREKAEKIVQAVEDALPRSGRLEAVNRRRVTQGKEPV